MGFDQLFNDARSVMTAIALFTFLAIVVWAYSGRRAQHFAEAANLPFADDGLDMNKQDREKQHG